jgi:hypothetical protein
MNGWQSMRGKLTIVALGLVLSVLPASTPAAEKDPPASSEVTAAMQPYLEQYKLAGYIAIIADKDGKVHHRNLLQVHRAAQQVDGR